MSSWQKDFQDFQAKSGSSGSCLVAQCIVCIRVEAEGF